ncbi:MAG: lipoprotein-releasing ABC transporter permease subunit [Pseudomonadota bacterium]
MADAAARPTRAFSAFEWALARRYLGATKSGRGVSLISVIAFLGILAAVMVLIVVMAVMQGFRSQLLDTLLGVNGHVFVQDYEGIEDYEAAAERIGAIPGVARAAPMVESPVYISSELGQAGAQARGYRKRDVESLSYVADRVVSGSLATFEAGENGGSDILIAAGLARRLGVSAGDTVTLISGNGPETAFGRLPVRSKRYRIGAVFEIGMSELDAVVLVMPMRQAQLFFGVKDKANSIEITVEKPEVETIDRYLPPIRAAAPEGAFVYDWRQTNQAFFNALAVERNVMRLILTLIVVVAALNIITGLIMLVKDKTSDIAVLRTLGATQGAVMRVFFLSGSMIGVFATLAGVTLGALFCWNISAIERFLSAVFNMRLFNPEIYFFSEIPAQMQLSEVLYVTVGSLAASFLATLYPSWRAARLDPVEALRYE